MLTRRLALAALAALPAAGAAAAPVPGFLTRPSADRAVTAGLTFDMPSRAQGETRRITVWLPPSYAGGTASYPVLYLLDGGVEQDYLPVVGLAALGGLTQVTDEMIVVGVESTRRARDYTTPSSREAAQSPDQGGSEAFRRFLVEELKPLVERRWRTSGESGLIGESLAGLFVVDTALRAPEAFTRYIAVSPSLWWDDEGLSRQAAGLLNKPFPQDRSLYLAIANEGGTMQSGMDRLVAALKANTPPNLTWRYEPFPGERHHSVYHPAGQSGLRWSFPGPKPVGPTR